MQPISQLLFVIIVVIITIMLSVLNLVHSAHEQVTAWHLMFTKIIDCVDSEETITT